MQFFPEEKERVCLNLALSLLNFPTTIWRQVYWGSSRNSDDGVFFLRNPASGNIVNRISPYLSCQLRDTPLSKDDETLPCDPQLLDFAKLIMEIHMWQRLPSKPGKELYGHLDKLINDTRIFRPRDSQFRSAVLACLSGDGKDAARDETDKDRLRNYIFDRIVRPLEDYADFPDFLEPPSEEVDHEHSRARPEVSVFDWSQGYEITEDRSSVAACRKLDTLEVRHTDYLSYKELESETFKRTWRISSMVTSGTAIFSDHPCYRSIDMRGSG